MNRKQLIAELLAEYRKSLNPSSKWFTQDIQEFKEKVSELRTSEVAERLRNRRAFNSPAFEKLVAKEEAKLNKAGMYDIGNMRPENALD